MPTYVEAQTTQLYGDPLYGKPRGVRVEQGTTSWVSLPLRDPATGGPLVVAVGGYSTAPVAVARYREAVGANPTVFEVTNADLAADGTAARFEVPTEVADVPGVYRAQVRLTADAAEIAREEVLVLVDRGLFLTDGSAPSNDRGPPTFAEVRTALRDHPGANRLLGDFEFDPAEVGHALVAAVAAFNAEFPVLPRLWTTIDFPVAARRPWIDGALGYLFETAAHYHRRGHLPYAAAGLSVDDLAKEKDYFAAAQFYQQRFVRWCRITHARVSHAAAWGTLGSGFSPYTTF